VSLDDWLVDQVVDGYGLPRATAKELVRDRRIVPLLDGLDEMDADGAEPTRAARALEQLNSYRAGNEDAPLVVTCREARYEQLLARDSRLQHAAQPRVQPVSSECL
jgi:predicted NACHT family NTPase